jgi:phage N-6-adenine-methyltransferase
MSSATDQWATPQWLVDACAEQWGPFDLDPAADADNHKAPAYYTAAQDGLHRPWAGRVWLNPPYGAGIGDWCRRAAEATDKGEAACVVACLPARTDTSYWHAWVMRACEVRLLRGRVAFGGGTMPAPFPTAIVVWAGRMCRGPEARVSCWDLRARARGQLVLLDDEE